MVNYACGLNQSETGKYFEWIINQFIRGIKNNDKIHNEYPE